MRPSLSRPFFPETSTLEVPVDYIDRIADLGACAPALDWLRSEQYPSLQAAWDACPRSNWMLWLLSTMDHPAYPTAYAAATPGIWQDWQDWLRQHGRIQSD